MHQIELAGRRWLNPDVMTQYLERSALGGHPRGVEIAGHHSARWADLIRQPRRHTGPTGADLPTGPSRRDADAGEMPEGHRIEQLRQRLEPSACLRLLVVQQIPLVARHAAILLAGGRAGSDPTHTSETGRKASAMGSNVLV